MYQIVNQTIPVAQLGGATFEIQRRTLSVQTASGEAVLFEVDARTQVWVASSNPGDFRLWAVAIASTPGFPFPRPRYFQIRAGNPAAGFLPVDDLRRRTRDMPEPHRRWCAPCDALIPAQLEPVKFAHPMRRPKDMKAHIRLPEWGYVSIGGMALIDVLQSMDDLSIARTPSSAQSRSALVRIAQTLHQSGVEMPTALATSLRLRVNTDAIRRAPPQPGRTVSVHVRPGSRVLVVAERTPSFAMAAAA